MSFGENFASGILSTVLCDGTMSRFGSSRFLSSEVTNNLCPIWPWGEVEKVLAFKRDNFSKDEICLLFVCERDQCLEVTEEDQGYRQVGSLNCEIICLASRPSEEWFMNVAFPAFKTNTRMLWERS